MLSFRVVDALFGCDLCCVQLQPSGVLPRSVQLRLSGGYTSLYFGAISGVITSFSCSLEKNDTVSYSVAVFEGDTVLYSAAVSDNVVGMYIYCCVQLQSLCYIAVFICSLRRLPEGDTVCLVLVTAPHRLDAVTKGDTEYRAVFSCSPKDDAVLC